MERFRERGCERPGPAAPWQGSPVTPLVIADSTDEGAPAPPSARSVGIAQFLLGDGSVRPISESIDLAVYRALGTRAGGETVGEF